MTLKTLSDFHTAQELDFVPESHGFPPVEAFAELRCALAPELFPFFQLTIFIGQNLPSFWPTSSHSTLFWSYACTVAVSFGALASGNLLSGSLPIIPQNKNSALQR
jgi:hypothetical protein